MNKICTLIAIPDTIIEGSTYDILNKRWPNAACHDGINKVFNGYDGSSDTSLIVSDAYAIQDDEAMDDYINRLVFLLGPILFAEDRLEPIHILKPIMSQLFKHPAYRLFCGKYETKENLSTDRILVTGNSADMSKTLEELNIESRVILEQILGGA